MQSLRRYVLLAPLVTVAVAFGDAAPVGAKDTGVCTPLTRPEAGELLGAQVVKTSKKTSKPHGAQECTDKTHKAQKRLSWRGGRRPVERTLQPVPGKDPSAGQP